MRILQLCNKYPYPPNDGGSIAVYNLTTVFAENNHLVSVLSMNTSKHRTELSDVPDEFKRSVDLHFVPVNTNINPLKLLLNLLFSAKPYNAVRFISNDFRSDLQKILSENQFDIVQLEGLYLAPYIGVIRKYSKALISYRAHNVEHEIWQRNAEKASNPLKKYYYRVLARRLEHFEKDILNQYDVILPITERDAIKLQEMGNVKSVKTVPTGILSKDFVKSSAPEKISSLFYIGALDWIPNQDALTWIIREVWNDVKTTNHELSFHIAGRNAPAWFAKFCIQHDVTFHGEVENAYDFYKDKHIMVVPLFAGGGMRIKIIEAMARSKVVITTSIGAEGLGLTNNEQVLIAENASEFKKGIMNLLENREFFTKLEKNSYDFISKNFSNEKIGKDLLQFYKQQLAE